MFGIVEHLAASTVMQNPEAVAKTLSPVFMETEMTEFYRSRLCTVEILVSSTGQNLQEESGLWRASQEKPVLESVYFPTPHLYTVSQTQIEDDMRSEILNKCALDPGAAPAAVQPFQSRLLGLQVPARRRRCKAGRLH